MKLHTILSLRSDPSWAVLNLVMSLLLSVAATQAQSPSLPTDRARVTVASIPDPYGGPNLKVLRTDANTPLRAGTAWIWEKMGQEEPASYYVSMKAKRLNAVRMILFDTWEVEAYQPSAQFTPTNWNDSAYRTRQLARMERAVNYASANGMYVIINSHNKIPNYDETYNNRLWTWVAPYFANRTHVLYELANEPMHGIGANGDMDTGGNAQNSPRLQALRRGYNIARAGAPNTHLMILTPPGINDAAYGTGMGNLAASFAAMPGVAVDWTKTSVAYHLYGNDAAYGAANNAANLRNLHSRYPGWPSENAFPPGNIPGAIGLDQWRSQPFPGDNYVNQTCERLGLGWSMWFINGPNQLNTNFPIMWADAVARGWTWQPDSITDRKVNLPMSNTAPVIDGNLDAAWSGAPANNITKAVIGTVASASDLSGTWRGMWDATNFYVFVDVSDNVKINDSGAAWYDDDAVEIYIDANNSKGTGYDGVNDYQYVFRWNDPAVLETKLARTAGVTFAHVDTATGYRLEIKFPWTTPGLTPAYGSRFGIEVMLNDDDNGGARERKLAWHGTTDGASQNPSLFGVAQLEPPVGTGTGLRGDYYDNIDFTGTLLTRTDTTVNFDWGNGSPDPTMGVDTFSVRWTGQVQPRYSETYSFSTTTDDGVRLWVNGQLLIDKWLNQAPTEWSGTITLMAGQTYDLQLDYFENGYGAQAKLQWSSASQSKEIIPQTQLYPATTLPSAPAAPSALTVVVVGASQLNLNWTDNADNETGFKIERKTGSSGNYAQIATTPQNLSSYSDTSLSASTEYFYRVRANNMGGDSVFSNTANATTGATTALLAYEGFDQPAANFVNYSGATSFGFVAGSHWGSSGSVNMNSSVISPGLGYLGMTSTGGMLDTPSSASYSRFSRALGTPAQNLFNAGSTGYVSLLFRVANGNRWDLGQNDANVGFGVSGGLIGLMTGVDGYTFRTNGLAVPLNVTNLLVCKIQRLAASTVVSLYLNPTASRLESSPDFTYTYGASIGFLMSAYKANSIVAFDEIRVAASFQSVIPVPASSFTLWAASKGLTGLDAQPGANPDGDEFNNLLEYALATNPAQANPAPYLTAYNNSQLTLTYLRPTVAPDLTYTVEWSETLAAGSWSTLGVAEQILNDNGTTRTVQTSVTSTATRRFIRLKIKKD